MTDSDIKRSRQRNGQRAEDLAAFALRLKGYRILARRWTCAAGEIDLIARRGQRVAFVEVKLRPGQDDSEAHQSVGPQQRARIRRAAEVWQARHPHHRDRAFGFDIVLVSPWRWPRHIENGL